MVNGWNEITLEELCVPSGLVRGPFGGALKKEIFVANGYKIYEQRNAIYATTEIGNYYISDEKYKELARFAISDDDFIVSCSGTIGCIFRIPQGAPKGVINQALLKITLNEEVIDVDLFQQYFRSEPFQKSIIDDTQGGAMKNLVGMDKFRKALFVIPSEKKEQQAIAATLSDTDAYIAALEKLITKKRAIKKGTMQELLTGKRRLPGFDGEWKTTTLGTLGTFSKGRGISKAESHSGKIPCVRYGEIYTVHNDIVKAFYSHISQSVAATSRQLKKGELLFAGSGETKEEIGKCVAFISDCEAYAGGDIIILTPFEDYNSYFLGYYLNSRKIGEQKASHGQGDAIVHIHIPSLSEIEIYLPPTITEQTVIAEILSDMDAEIDALTAKLNKVHNIKQGMMQELLTGRIRLVQLEAETKIKAVAKPVIYIQVEAAAKRVAETGIDDAIAKTAPADIASSAPQRMHNQQFDDAVMIAGIVNVFYDNKYPLGRKKVQKLLYLLRRHQDESTATFKKKAAGPYADEVRYKGGEPAAVKSDYIRTHQNDKGTIFAKGKKLDQALYYIVKWDKQKDIQWLVDNFRFTNVNDLELLATVDMAICDLEEAGTPVSVASIKHLIATNAEWKAKLKRQTFSDANIARAIKELQTLL